MNIAVLPQRLLSRIVDRLVYSLYLIKMLDCITFSYYKGEIANINLKGTTAMRDRGREGQQQDNAHR